MIVLNDKRMSIMDTRVRVVRIFKPHSYREIVVESPKSRLVWRVLAWLGRKSGLIVQVEEESATTSYVEISGASIEILIQHSLRARSEHGMDEIPGTIFIGRKEFDELVSIPSIHMRGLTLSARGETGYFNIPLRVIPWMSGVLVI